MSVPAGLRLAFTEIFATVNMLHGIAENDSSQHTQGFPNDDLYVAPATRVEHPRSTPSWVTTERPAASRINGDSTTADRDGIARLRWNKLQDLPVFDAQVETTCGFSRKTLAGG